MKFLRWVCGFFPKVLVVLNYLTDANQGGVFFFYGNTIWNLSYPVAFLVKTSFLNMSVCIIKVVLKYCLLHRTVVSEVTQLIVIHWLWLHCALQSWELKSYDRCHFIASTLKNVDSVRAVNCQFVLLQLWSMTLFYVVLSFFT